MCGFAGIFGRPLSISAPDIENKLALMGASILHRGPDDSGIWHDVDSGIGLIHRRLSILDLSKAGHQPMLSESGRYVIAYNGEIYNHLELREKLGKKEWIGHSDTETLLSAFESWGIEKTLANTTGMFAISLWDRREKILYLARDRVGEKPLYYGKQGNIFLFGSELKSLKKLPEFSQEIDRASLSKYLHYSYIPSPHTIYENIYKLPPGTYIKVEGDGAYVSEPITYWSLWDVVKNAQNNMISCSDSEAIDLMQSTLLSVVRQQQISDVPVGAFLSGGIDSSTIVALMQAQSSQKVRTFTIGFEEEGYNESQEAKVIADHLNTDHSELFVTSEQARAVIPLLPQIYDEPFADSSQIPTYLVSKMASEHVKVSLSGDAGDELFGGYNRYLWSKKVFNTPSVIRKTLAHMILMLSPRGWDRVFNVSAPLLPKSIQASLPGDKLHKLATIFLSNNLESLYDKFLANWSYSEGVVIGQPSSQFDHIYTEEFSSHSSIEEYMMYLDSMNYLPDDILVKVDRAAMAVSLETRVPFLDHRLIELAWRLPLKMKIREGQSKWILRQILYKHVPREMMDRPKMGFGVPIDKWLRGPLKEWAEDLLSEERLKRQGFFDYGKVRKKWSEHICGRRNWQSQLWALLMFQEWFEYQSGNAK